MADQEVRIAILENAYESLERRMDKIEEKLDQMSEEIKINNHSMIKVLVASAGTIVGAVLSTLVVVLTQMM